MDSVSIHSQILPGAPDWSWPALVTALRFICNFNRNPLMTSEKLNTLTLSLGMNANAEVSLHVDELFHFHILCRES